MSTGGRIPVAGAKAMGENERIPEAMKIMP